MATRLFSHSLLLYSQFPRAVDSRTSEDESPSTRVAARSLLSNFSVMRFLGERRGITAERDFLLVLCPRASPRSHTSNCRSRMLQVHMIRSAWLSAFIFRGKTAHCRLDCANNSHRISRLLKKIILIDSYYHNPIEITSI